MNAMRASICCVALLLAGCASVNHEVERLPPTLWDRASDAGRVTAAAVGRVVRWGNYASVAEIVVDPGAPNWEIEEAWFPGRHFHLQMKMRRAATGGAGEAQQAFRVRAAEIARRNNAASYVIVEYTESLESSVLGAQRVASGIVRLVDS